MAQNGWDDMPRKELFVKIAEFIFNPRFLLCFGLAWIITNGWSYIMFGIGAYFKIEWMIAVAGAYLAFLWLPISPEKIVTLLISMALLQWLFPNDEKTLGMLKSLYSKARTHWKDRKDKKKSKNEKVED